MGRWLVIVAAHAGCRDDAVERPACSAPSPAGLCCSADYAATALTDLAAAPTSFLGRRVYTSGRAEVETPTGVVTPCTCSGAACACTRRLQLRSDACPDAAIELGGEYLGRAVECSDLGCWPLTPPGTYIVCGDWRLDPADVTVPAVLFLSEICAGS